MLTATAFVALSLAGAVLAQDPNTKYQSSLNMTVDVNNILPADGRALMLAGWCNAQTNTCDTLCGTDTNANNCIAETLKWECTCSSNDSTPGLQYYTQTMPTFICEELYNECNRNNVGNRRLQDACTKNIQDLCATQSPPKDPVTSDSGSDSGDTTTTTTTMATRTTQPTGSATGNAASSSTSQGLAAPTMVAAGNGVGIAAAVGVLAYLL